MLRQFNRQGYRCLFDASSQSIRDVAAATRSLKNGQLGFFGVLHTWGRGLQTYHPHIHYVVPGGGVKVDGNGNPTRWQSTPQNFLFHHGTLLRVYKAKLADELRAAGLYELVPTGVWKKGFVLNIQSVGHGVPTLKHLAPYVHRVAISNKRIESVDASSVKYTVLPSKSRRALTRTANGEEFVRAFAQHILPRGFQKIRHYGWMNPNAKIKLAEVKWLVWLYFGWTFWLGNGHSPQDEPLGAQLRFAKCGGAMRVVNVTYDTVVLPKDNGLTYFDSG